MVVVISERHRKAIHLDAEPLLEQFLGTDDFVLDPFFVVGPGQLFSASFAAWSITVTLCPSRKSWCVAECAWISTPLSRRSASCSQVIASPPPRCTAADAFSVNEHRERIAVFFHDRPRYFILRFPAVVESNYGRTRRYVLFAPLPGEQILHRDHA